MENTQVLNHKCPSCAAPLSYNIETRSWLCDFCGNSYTADTLFAGNDVVEKSQEDFTPKAWEENQFTDEEGINAYSCSNCGGRVISDKNTVATFCAFCHSPTIIMDRLNNDIKPDVVIPFKITKDQALVEFKKMLRSKPLLPRKFRDSIKKGEITGLYAPFWLFSSDIDFNLTATCEKIQYWTTGDYAYTKRDRYRVDRAGDAPISKLPVDASQRLDDQLMDAIEPFSYNELTDFNTHYLSGMFAEAYDVKQEQSYNRFTSRTNRTLQNYVSGSLGGYQATTINSFAINPRNVDVKYAMLPVWIISAKYKTQEYVYIINGQTGKSAGKLPVSPQRFGIIFSGLLVVISFLIKFLFS